jgi:hypothetical protein
MAVEKLLLVESVGPAVGIMGIAVLVEIVLVAALLNLGRVRR